MAHSLGGLIARYAIALLYSNGDNAKGEAVIEDKIAGLEPVNFITFATPHLGNRSHKQVSSTKCHVIFLIKSSTEMPEMPLIKDSRIMSKVPLMKLDEAIIL